MGASQAKPSKTPSAHHVPDLNLVKDIVNGIMNPETNKFRDPRYAFGSGNTCENFTVVLESELKKYLKIELLDMRDNILLLPRKDGAHVNNKYVTKSDLCEVISGHYNRILKLLQVIKKIFDLEHNGDMSIGGICIRQIINSPTLMQIGFCNSRQKDYTKRAKADSNGDTNPEALDFNMLEGLSVFTNEILEPGLERNMFLHNLQAILESRDTQDTLDEYLACGDKLSQKIHKRVIKTASTQKCAPNKQQSLGQKVQEEKRTTSMTVASRNPILHTEVCHDPDSIVIDKTHQNLTTQKRKKLDALYNTMIDDYKLCLQDIKNLLYKIVKPLQKPTKAAIPLYTLQDLTTQEIDALEDTAKETITTFFYTSLRNYHQLLDFVLDDTQQIPQLKTRLETNKAPPVTITQTQNGGKSRRVRKVCKHHPKTPTQSRRKRCTKKPRKAFNRR